MQYYLTYIYGSFWLFTAPERVIRTSETQLGSFYFHVLPLLVRNILYTPTPFHSQGLRIVVLLALQIVCALIDQASPLAVRLLGPLAIYSGSSFPVFAMFYVLYIIEASQDKIFDTIWMRAAIT